MYFFTKFHTNVYGCAREFYASSLLLLLLATAVIYN